METAPLRNVEPEAPLSKEVSFEPYPGSQWYGPDGEPVPKKSEIINAITGPDHCDWENGVMMHVGWPPGHAAADSSESRQFIRDPKRVFPQKNLAGTFDGDAELPRAAEDTGYRTDFMKLWLDPKDGSAAYLVFADHTERWPRATDIIACA